MLVKDKHSELFKINRLKDCLDNVGPPFKFAAILIYILNDKNILFLNNMLYINIKIKHYNRVLPLFSVRKKNHAKGRLDNNTL